MIKACINDIDCILYYDERVSIEQTPTGFPYMYYLRHDECDWTKPISIERLIFVNFFGTIFTRKPILFNENDYIAVETFKIEHQYIRFSVSRELSGIMLSL